MTERGEDILDEQMSLANKLLDGDLDEYTLGFEAGRIFGEKQTVRLALKILDDVRRRPMRPSR